MNDLEKEKYNEKARLYRLKNKEKLYKYNHERYIKKKKLIDEEKKIFYLQNKDIIDKEKEKNKIIQKEKRKIYSKIYYLKNKDRIDKHRKEYNLKNREKIKKRKIEWLLKNKEYNIWYNRMQNKEYRKKNRYKLNKAGRRYYQKRYKEDINYKLNFNLHNRIYAAIKGNVKSKHTKELLGCSIEELKEHLEKQFKPGMTWKNYSYRGWHIDHIIPCSKFDLSKSIEQQKCFHYTNLQPLWQQENMIKKDKVIISAQ